MSTAADGTRIETTVVEGGEIGEHKGINAPGVPLPTSAITPKDIEDLQFGLSLGVDMVALSFVQSAADIRQARQLLADAHAADVPLIAKLERPQALEHHHRVADVEDLVEVVQRLRPLEFRDQRDVRGVRVGEQLARLPDVGGALHEAERDHVDAQTEPELQILDVLRRNRRRRQRHTRRVDPFVLADLAAFDDGRLDPSAVGAVDAQLDAAVGEQQPIAGAHARASAANVVEICPGRPGKSPVSITRRSPGFTRIGRPPSSVPVRIFGPPRSWRIATSRRRVAPPRGCGRTSQPATRACHGKN